MSTPFSDLFGSRQIVPQIEHDYQMRMMAHDVRTLKEYHLAALHLQAIAAAEQLRAMADMTRMSDATNVHLDQILEEMATLLSGVDLINDSLEHLNDIGDRTLDAIVDLSGILDEGLTRISQQMVENGKSLARIEESLRHPYKRQERELSNEAQKWLTRGMNERGHDQKEDWADAIRLIRMVVENPIGRQDYVAFFQLGYLLWKHENNLPAAEVAFHRAQRLGANNGDSYYVTSLRHLARVQRLQHKYRDAHDTMTRALAASREYLTMYDGACYSALIDHRDESVNWIEQCIDIQPMTIYTMFSEPDFGSIRTELLQLASRRTHEARGSAEIAIQRCHPTLDWTAWAERSLGLRIPRLPVLAAEAEKISQRLGEADYLASLQLEKRSVELRETLIKHFTTEIQNEISTRRYRVTAAQDALSAIERERESIVAEAKRQGVSLIEKLRAPGEAEVRRARSDLETAVHNHDKADQDTSSNLGGGHVGLGCLCGCVTHFVVAGLIIYLLYGPKPGAIDNLPLGLWILGGWIPFVILYGYLFTQLSTWNRIRRLKNAESEKREGLEQAQIGRDELLREVQLKADGLLGAAKSMAEAQFAERCSTLKEDLRRESNGVSEAESILAATARLK